LRALKTITDLKEDMTPTLLRLLVNTILETSESFKVSDETREYLTTAKYIRLKKAIEIPLDLLLEKIDLKSLLLEDSDYNLKHFASMGFKYYMKFYISKKYTDLFSHENINSLYPNIYVPQLLAGIMGDKRSKWTQNGTKYKIIVTKDQSGKFQVIFICMDKTKDIYNRLLAIRYTILCLNNALEDDDALRNSSAQQQAAAATTRAANPASPTPPPTQYTIHNT
jgi:hypothetical protein